MNMLMLIRCMQGGTRGSAHFFAAFNPNVLFPTSLLMFSPSFISFIRFFFCVLILFKFLLLFVSSSQLIIYLLFLLCRSIFFLSFCLLQHPFHLYAYNWQCFNYNISSMFSPSIHRQHLSKFISFVFTIYCF